jgi:hypothetical protein
MIHERSNEMYMKIFDTGYNHIVVKVEHKHREYLTYKQKLLFIKI